MNLSYFRIKDCMENAINRLEVWNGQPFANRTKIDYGDVVDNSVDENDEWKGSCLYVYENDGWTVFEDVTGAYSSIEAERWCSFAKEDKFVFAGYNDAIPYGEMIVISNGKILKDFADDLTDMEFCHNNGEEYKDIVSWSDVAAFVDDDELVYSDTGLLIF